jgi:hypothetical protein
MRKFLAYMCVAAALSAPLIALPAASATAATGSSGAPSIPAAGRRAYGFGCNAQYRSSGWTHCGSVEISPGETLRIRLSGLSHATPVYVTVTFTYSGTSHKIGEKNFGTATFGPRSGEWFVARNRGSNRIAAHLYIAPYDEHDHGWVQGNFILYP